jgi:hypothetical protein
MDSSVGIVSVTECDEGVADPRIQPRKGKTNFSILSKTNYHNVLRPAIVAQPDRIEIEGFPKSFNGNPHYLVNLLLPRDFIAQKFVYSGEELDDRWGALGVSSLA